MAKEIERKFLICDRSLVENLSNGEEITQGYLSDNPDATVRIRIKGNCGFLTVKSRNHGATRGEWEYQIPVEDCRQMISECRINRLITKTRYRFDRWEIDVFHGNLEGLIIAEIELSSESESITLPSFIGREVTNDSRYYNSALISVNTDEIDLV